MYNAHNYSDILSVPKIPNITQMTIEFSTMFIKNKERIVIHICLYVTHNLLIEINGSLSLLIY